MTTTDAMRGKPVEPYHIYLRRPEHRASAWWSTSRMETMEFATFEEAVAERDRLSIGRDRRIGQVAPKNDTTVAPFWTGSDVDHR
jgi:hypothetical protein